jgi:tRNA(Arg) A34 adenosine deaminase TadA
LVVIMAQRGGTFRETISIGKADAEARERHGESELLDEIVAAKPESVAAAHREDGHAQNAVSHAEQAAIDSIEQALA